MDAGDGAVIGLVGGWAVDGSGGLQGLGLEVGDVGVEGYWVVAGIGLVL